MRLKGICGFLVVLTLLPVSTALAQWSNVAPGFDYQQFAAPGPNNVFVVRMDRSSTATILDSSLGQGKLYHPSLYPYGRETVSAMAVRYDDIIGYWGQEWGKYRYDVVCAINGDFWDTTLGQPQNGHIESGWYTKRFGNFTGGSGLIWQLDRDLFIGGCVNHIASKNQITYVSSGQTQNIHNINYPPDTDQMTVFTPQYYDHTATDNSVTEVVVELSRPAMILPSPSGATGTVKEIRQNLGSTPIPFDCVVLSAKGSAASKLISNVSIGSEVKISQEITNYEPDCSTSRPGDWTKTYTCIGGNWIFLENSVVNPYLGKPGAIIRNPRTAIAYDANYIYYLVVDGRSAISMGMTMQEIGDFCKNTLGATHGINLDGGGSSAIWVNGQIKNVPSDGSERATYNGMLMIRLQEKLQSTTFAAGQNVAAPSGTAVRLGPGTNYGVVAALTSGRGGVIANHSINGVYAKGKYWWKWEIPALGVEGWSEEGSLSLAPADVSDWMQY